jgi:hypothetical protein
MQRLDDLPNFWLFLGEIVKVISLDNHLASALILMLIVMLTLHGMFVLFLTISFHKIVDKYLKPNSIFVAGLLYFIAINLIFISHFVDLIIWTYATLLVDAIKEPMNAFYFVGEMYTTLGFGQFTVPSEWRILPIIISIDGIFSASISAAELYSMLHVLTTNSKASANNSGV